MQRQSSIRDSLPQDTNALRGLEEAYRAGNVSAREFNDIMSSASADAQRFAQSTLGAAGSTDEFVSGQLQQINALNQSSRASQLAAIGVEVLNAAISSGAIFLLTSAFQLLIGIVDSAIITLEEQREKVEECSAAFNKSQTEVKNINDKLAEQDKLLTDLQNKKTPALTDKNEIDNLQKLNAELRIQADLAKKNEENAQKDLAMESAKLVTKQYTKETATEEDVEQRLAEANQSGNNASLIHDENDLASMLAGYRKFGELAKDPGVSGSLDDQEHFLQMTEDISASLWERVENLAAQKSNMQGYYDEIKEIPYDKLTEDQQFVVDNYNRTANEIKLIYSELDSGTWNQMQFDRILDTTGLEKTKEELIEMSNAGTLDEEALKSYDNLYQAISSSDMALQDGKDSTETFLDIIKQLAAEEKRLAQLQPEIVPTLSYDEITKAADEYTKSINTIISSMKSLDSAIKEQNEYGSLSVDTVMNLVDSGYAAALQYDASANSFQLNTDALTSLTQARIEDQIVKLESQKTNIIDTLNAETDAAYDLANGYLSVKAARIGAETPAEAILAARQYNNIDTQIGVIEQLKGNIGKMGTDEFSIGRKAKKTSSGGSDPVKEAFTKELTSLKHNLEMEYITQKDYYDSLDELNQSYFKDKPKYLDDYRKYQEELYKGLRDYYKEQTESTMDLLEKQLDAGTISYQHYSSTVSSLLSTMFSEGKISAADYHTYMGDMLNKQLDIYNSVLSAVTKRFDREIDGYQKLIDGVEKQNDALEKKKDNYDAVLGVIERVYDKEIESLTAQQDAIQDKIDSLSEEADAYDLIYRKEQAVYELNRSMNQRTKKVYTADKGYIYETDRRSIKEAEKNLEDIKNEELINLLEKEQNSLQDSIDILEDWKNKWSEISEAYSMAQDELLAKEMLGAEYQKIILENNISDLDEFKNSYITIEQQINDNTSLIESYNEKIIYYESLKEQWSGISDAYQTEMEKQYAANVLGQNWEADVLSGRLSTLNDFKSTFINIQQALADAAWNASNEIVKAAEAASNGANGTLGSAGSAGSSNSSSGPPPPTYKVVHTTSGYVYQDSFSSEALAYKWIAEQEEKRRIPTSIIRKLTVKKFRHGGILSPSIPELDLLAKQQGEHHISTIAWRDGESVITREQTQLMQKMAEAITISPNLLHPVYKTPAGLDQQLYSPRNASTGITNHVTVTLPNITNEGGYQNFTKFLTRFELDTMQYANRR